MKKIIYILLLSIIFNPICVFAKEKANGEELLKNATSGVLMEQSTGKIIFEKNKDKKVAVASMTKMVAQIIILEQIESGKIKWSDIVEVSKNAADMGGSQIFLTPGEKMSVKDLMKGISVASANDATVAMAEYIAGNEKKFVEMMNSKVEELGLKNTSFKNPTGLDEEGHYSTAYDMAIIARTLLSHEQIISFSSIYEDYLRKNTENQFWLVNTNKLVRYYKGADGLKTGHTDLAKYCLAATANRDNMRLIAIVLGEEVSKIRNSEAMQLLDYGFNNKKITTLKKKNDLIKEVQIDKGNKDKIGLIAANDINVLEDKNTNDHKYNYKVKVNSIKLPIKKGDSLGKISVYENNNKVNSVSIVSNTDVDRLNYFKLVIKILENIVTGKV